jgi:hypothetical protein
MVGAGALTGFCGWEGKKAGRSGIYQLAGRSSVGQSSNIGVSK